VSGDGREPLEILVEASPFLFELAEYVVESLLSILHAQSFPDEASDSNPSETVPERSP
jgi:hypothetical protein